MIEPDGNTLLGQMLAQALYVPNVGTMAVADEHMTEHRQDATAVTAAVIDDRAPRQSRSPESRKASHRRQHEPALSP
jgi:hypothetical protein